MKLMLWEIREQILLNDIEENNILLRDTLQKAYKMWVMESWPFSRDTEQFFIWLLEDLINDILDELNFKICNIDWDINDNRMLEVQQELFNEVYSNLPRNIYNFIVCYLDKNYKEHYTPCLFYNK